MDKDFEDRLRKDLEVSGMHSELVARRTFRESGWASGVSLAYFDRDENRAREFDISAHIGQRVTVDNGYSGNVSLHVFAEVKKSEKPWIAFKKKLPDWAKAGCAWNNLIGTERLPCEPIDLTRSLQQHSLKGTNGWEGISIHEAFKKPDQPSRWYGAFVTASKAADWYLNTYCNEDRDEHESKDHDEGPEISFLQPLVILDGVLVSAELSDSGEVALNEVPSAAFSFSYKTKEYKRDSYRVDLVTLSGLSDYLAGQKLRLASIVSGLKVEMERKVR